MTKNLVTVLALFASITSVACSHAPAAGSLHCSGSGGPTVVFMSGLASRGPDDWREVRQSLAARTTVCVHERAEVHTAGAIADQLDRLLREKRAPRPYVLVAHSFGAIPARLFAARHPDAIAGMVLVDPSHEDMARITALLPVDVRARLEGAPPMSPDGVDLEMSFAELRAERRERSFPLVVIEAGHDEIAPNEIWTTERIHQRAGIIRDLNEKLAASAPRGRFMLAEKAGHFVQIDEPAVVVEAVRWVLSKPSQTRADVLLRP